MKSDTFIDISNGIRKYKPCEIHQSYCYSWRKLYEQQYFNDFGKTVDDAIKEAASASQRELKSYFVKNAVIE